MSAARSISTRWRTRARPSSPPGPTSWSRRVLDAQGRAGRRRKRPAARWYWRSRLSSSIATPPRRLGITPQNIDDTLDDAFGQRQVSTIFTQQNQYHVILEVSAEVPAQSRFARQHLREELERHAGSALDSFTHFPSTPKLLLPSTTRASSPRLPSRSTLAPGKSIGDAGQRGHQAESTPSLQTLPAAQRQCGSSRARPQPFEASLAAMSRCSSWPRSLSSTSCWACCTRATSTPSRSLSTLPSAGVGAILALLIFHVDLSVIALIGIILLIGIVKKNAIMMIDFALEAERDQGMEPRRGHLPGLPAPLSSDHDDDDGGPAWRRTARAWHRNGQRTPPPAGNHHRRRPHRLADSHALYTTPVVYLFFDRIGRKYFKTEEADAEFRRREQEQQHHVTVGGD